MEQQKILWVVISVLSVLAVVVCAGLFILNPDAGDLAAPAGTPLVSSLSNTLSVGEAEGDTSSDDSTPTEAAEEDTDPPILVIEEDFEEGGMPSVAEEYVIHGGDSVESPEIDLIEAEQVTTVVQQTVPAVPVRVPQPGRAVPQPANEPAPSEEVSESGIEFWIQVGSFSGRTRAEEVASSLFEEGIASVVTSLTTDAGDTFFRVRIGPYQNREQAAEFLETVVLIDGFTTSYISEVYR